MLRISRESSLDDLEDGFQAISDGEPLLQLPYSLKPSAAGIEGGLIQLIITWARRAGQGATLRLHSDRHELPEVSNFLHSPFGLIGASLSRHVQNQTGKPLDRMALLNLGTEYVANMSEGPLEDLRQYSRTSVPLICFDYGTRYRRPIRLYQPDGKTVRDRGHFSNLAANSIASLLDNRQFDASSFASDAGGLLYEVFTNTDEHAVRDAQGRDYRRSIRGILINYRYVEAASMVASAGSSTPLKDYYTGWQTRYPGGQIAQFVELSAFDSGPGLARRWLARNRELVEAIPSGEHLAEEYSAVAECLLKGRTTKGDDNSGNGLFRVMAAAKKIGGFIRIRTGNLSLVRAFDDTGGALVADDLRLMDMHSGSYQPQRMPWAEGTMISVLFPVNRAMSI